MVASTFHPPRPDVSPDVTKPCTRCRHHWRPSWLERVLLGRGHLCTSLDVRGITNDAVTGDSRLNPMVPCAEARTFGNRCGPRATRWEPRR